MKDKWKVLRGPAAGHGRVSKPRARGQEQPEEKSQGSGQK